MEPAKQWERTCVGRWSADEHQRFLRAIDIYGGKWKLVEEVVGTRTSTQCRSHGQKFFRKVAIAPKCKEEEVMHADNPAIKAEEISVNEALETASRGSSPDPLNRHSPVRLPVRSRESKLTFGPPQPSQSY